MTKIKTSELQGAALDYMTGIAAGEYVQVNPTLGIKAANPVLRRGRRWRPSTDWSQGGPLILQYGASLDRESCDDWGSVISIDRGDGIPSWVVMIGPTPLIAACRAIIAAKLGDEVDVPEELV